MEYGIIGFARRAAAVDWMVWIVHCFTSPPTQ